MAEAGHGAAASTALDIPGAGAPASSDHQWPSSWREASAIRSHSVLNAKHMQDTIRSISDSFSNKRHTSSLGDRSALSDESLQEPLLAEEHKDAHAVAAADSCGFWETAFNAANILAGVGLLTTPYALATGGWATSLLLLLIGGIACYTGRLLALCMQSDTSIKTYPDIAAAAFGPSGRTFLGVLLYVELFCCCVEYIILAGDNLSAVFPGAQVALLGVQLSASQTMVVLTFLLVLPTMWLRDMSLLSIISITGIFISIGLYLLVVLEGVLFTGFGNAQGVPVLAAAKLPVVVGIYSFCFSGHAVFPSLYTSMKDKSKFGILLVGTFSIVVGMYATIAVFGVLMFGSGLDDNITLNMQDSYPTAIPTYFAVWLTIITPFTKFQLTLAPVAMALEELLRVPENSWAFTAASVSIRTALMVLVLAVALVVPFFGFVMSFIGAFLSMSLSIVLPSICFLCIARANISGLDKVLCVIVAIFGIVAGTVATYDAVRNIANSYS